MRDYTPTTEEVRTDYIMAYTERQSSQLLAGLAFDRWHQAELRRAKAEALREAANYFASGLHCADMRTTPEETVHHLRNRADQIEENTNDRP